MDLLGLELKWVDPELPIYIFQYQAESQYVVNSIMQEIVNNVMLHSTKIVQPIMNDLLASVVAKSTRSQCHTCFKTFRDNSKRNRHLRGKNLQFTWESQRRYMY